MYGTYTDEELRRVLATDPKDAEALVEAADRFLAAPTGDVLEAAYEEGYQEGHSNGYAERVAEEE
jgi:flagellar biosynthesis/type III secretory pathway protein FliH